MDNIFGNGGMAQVKLYGTTDSVTMKATLKYTGTSDYKQTQLLMTEKIRRFCIKYHNNNRL